MDSNPELSALCHFPQKITVGNYKDIIESSFIEVGIMELMEESLLRISRKLGKDYKPLSIKHLNSAKKSSRYAFRGRGAASRECSPLRTSPTEE